MATQFVGLHMKVVLREPPGYQLMGIVRDVEAGSSLTLINVYLPGTQEWTHLMRIDALNIADLSEVKAGSQPATHAAPSVEPVSAPVPAQPAAQPAFVDPAILSLGRRSIIGTPSSLELQAASEHVRPPPGHPGALPALQLSTASRARTPDTDAVESLQRSAVEDVAHELDNTKPAESVETPKKKTRSRQSRQPKNRVADEDVQAASPSSNAQGGRGKGWRQTPILQSTASFQPFNSLKRNGRGRKGGVDNGWASEDVTEEMGDFDFENNLAKFDKRTIFDQMRKEDQVDDASRLVSHNRRVKPGTAGGKNLHYSENVLDLPSTITPTADYWNSEADIGVDGGDRSSTREVRSGQSVRRGENKTAAPRRSQSRKASAVLGGQPLTRVNSGVRHSQSSQRSTPKPDAHVANTKQQQLHQPRQPGLYLIPSDRRLETISTLQMLNLENIAANEIGFTEDLMAENAGRGIAEVAVTALSDPAMKVRFELAVGSSLTEASVNNSTVVILAGNNKSSIRALAAGRHLRNKDVNVVVCLVGIERERDLLEDLRRQVQLYRNFGGKVLSKNDFFEHLRKTSGTESRISISLIIDAMLGLTISFEELRVGDQATVYELMEWANRNEAFVLSVDIPTGIDPSTGKIAIIDGGHLFVKPRYVVAIGAPKRGLLEAVTPPRDGEPEPHGPSVHEDEWRLFIADLGLGSAVWRKAGTKARRGIDFDGKWVLEMQYRGASVDSDEE
ncbi:Enhancer of mRNA-decapping protein 3 [Paramyrothecium foliicola]|nr:Enhancer of mRNA-decapping protein 3 [Paramyrothecium foliicola]